MRRFAIVSLTGLLSLSVPAGAGERGWYASIEGGADWGNVSSDVITIVGGGLLGLDPLAPDTSVDMGWAVFGSFGVPVSDKVRIEGEFGSGSSDFGGISSLTRATAMANILYDIPVADDLSFSLGAGIGAAWLSVEPFSGAGLPSNDTALAYQGLASMSYDLSESVDLTITYRYLSASTPDGLSTLVGPSSGSASWLVRVHDVDISTVSVGLRFAL